MGKGKESIRLEAFDGLGKRYFISGERDVMIAVGVFERTSTWTYHTYDGRKVIREDDRTFIILPDNIRLTATDTNPR